MQLKLVQDLNQQELEQIIKLHKEILTESFIRNFGDNFLNIAYQTIIKSPNNIFITLKNQKKIIAYLVATVDGEKFNHEVMENNFLKLSLEIIKHSFYKPQVLLRLIQWRLSKPNSKKIKPELQFIAVAPNFQKRGLGTKLMGSMEREFKKRGILEYRVGTKAENKLSNNFYKKLGFKFKYKEFFFGDNFNYYHSPKF